MQTEFGTKLVPTITLEKNEQRMIICNTLNNSKITLHENSNLTLIAILTKGWKESLTLNFHLIQPNAKLNFIALILGTKENEFRFKTISHHEASQTEAHFRVRTALFDKSLISYDGNIIVEPTTEKTDAHLSHHVLLLSNQATVETTPSLEIKTDNVKAGHSASIGQLNKELLFYLASRGIDEKTSNTMLVKGFMESDLSHIPKNIHALLSEEINNIIPQPC